MLRRPARVSSPAALFLAMIGGCGSDGHHNADQSPEFETDPSVVQSALSNPIIDCQTAQGQCVVSAAGDFTAVQACNDTLATCLQDAASKANAIATALGQCRDDAQSCFTGGGKLSDCQTSYQTCSQAALGGGGGDAGVALPTAPTLPGAPTLPSAPTLPTAPSLPSLDAGIALPTFPGNNFPTPGSNGGITLPTFPQPGLPLLDGGALAALPPQQQCLFTLNQCVVADPTQAQKCGDDAKTCLMLP